MTGKLLIVDGNNAAHRFAHVASPVPAGERFGAYLGRLLREEQPTHALVVFDPLDGWCWRRELWPRYKAGREHNPEIDQVLRDARQQCRYWGVAQARDDDHEADDVIASYVGLAGGLEVLVVSGDKDLLQLVREPVRLRRGAELQPGRVRQRDDVRRRLWTPGEVFTTFGVAPSRMVDYLAMVGDATDGIPGVPGIGPKTARALLGEHGTLDEVLANAPLIQSTRLMRLLLDHKDQALMCRELVRLRTGLPLHLTIEQTHLKGPNR